MPEFAILGSLGISGATPPTAPKVRQVLALLLTRANQVVHLDSIIEELWADRPPRSAVTTVQTYVHQLRKALGPMGGNELLVTREPGYLLRLEPGALDADVFQRLAWRGQLHLENDRPAAAAAALREALDMWNGAALADVRKGPALAAHATHLAEQRLRALELRILADGRLGRHRELIGELRTLVAAYPLNEWMHGQLIDALNRCGRRAEALDSFQNLRTILDCELGLEPSAELRELQRAVLSDRR